MSDEKRAPDGPNLNHYDELIEVVREAADVLTGNHDDWRCAYPDRYRACTEADPRCANQQTRARACALLSRLPNQGKAALPKPPTLPE